jgi:hypothetical protein
MKLFHRPSPFSRATRFVLPLLASRKNPQKKNKFSSPVAPCPGWSRYTFHHLFPTSDWMRDWSLTCCEGYQVHLRVTAYIRPQGLHMHEHTYQEVLKIKEKTGFI